MPLRRDRDIDHHPPIPCWFCRRPMSVAKIVREGIILGRDQRRGGPERLFMCPACLKDNLCEETRRGRWFASPRLSGSLLELLFAKLPGGAPEEVLEALSWYRENEERRRLFFLQDGDQRYQGLSILKRLWPWLHPAEAGPRRRAARKGPARETGGSWAGGPGGPGRRPPSDGPAGGPRRPPRGERARRGSGGPAGTSDRRENQTRPEPVTPWDILGLQPGSGPEEIRKAFHRLAVKCHPDKVHSLGEEFRAMAHVKFQELKEAYDALMGRR